MAGFRILMVTALAAVGGAYAWAQTPASTSLAASAPKLRTAGDGSLTRWMCAGGLELEVRPLSYDDKTAANEWVVVYRRNGVAYSAERVDRKTAEALPVQRCSRESAVG